MADITLKAMPFDSNEILDPETGETTYDRVSYSRDLAGWMRAYFSNGILVPGGDVLGSQMQVLHKDGLTCTVKAGAVCINGRTGWLETDTDIIAEIGNAQPRIDLVVAELNIPNDRGIYIKILKGTPAVVPVPPAVTHTEDVYQIPLAQLNIAALSATIATIVDERPDYISNVTIGIKPPTGNDAVAVKVSSNLASKFKLVVGENDDVENALLTEYYATSWLLSMASLTEDKVIYTPGSYEPEFFKELLYKSDNSWPLTETNNDILTSQVSWNSGSQQRGYSSTIYIAPILNIANISSIEIKYRFPNGQSCGNGAVSITAGLAAIKDETLIHTVLNNYGYNSSSDSSVRTLILSLNEFDVTPAMLGLTFSASGYTFSAQIEVMEIKLIRRV